MSNANDKIAEIVSRNSRYKPDAYSFVLKVVERSVSKLETPRHLSAKEVLTAVGELAGEEFGNFGKEVLEEWGVENPSDVGRIVYIMIDAGLLSADDKDSPTDFDVEFDLFPPEKRRRKRKIEMPKID